MRRRRRPDAASCSSMPPCAARYVSLPITARAVLACHPYPPPLARVLARAARRVRAARVDAQVHGSLIAQLRGDGPVRLLVVECTETLGAARDGAMGRRAHRRARADATLADLAGGAAHGRLVLTLDPKGAGTIYQGIVALESGSVAGLIEHYLATSEQLASRLVLAATRRRRRRACSCSACPAPPTTTTRRGRASRSAIDALAPRDLLDRGERHRRASPRRSRRTTCACSRRAPVGFACSCSRERVENALRIAGVAEVESILAERGDVEVTCEFCNRRYTFASGRSARGVRAGDRRMRLATDRDPAMTPLHARLTSPSMTARRSRGSCDDYPFATLVTPAAPEPYVSHLPLLLVEDGERARHADRTLRARQSAWAACKRRRIDRDLPWPARLRVAVVVRGTRSAWCRRGTTRRCTRTGRSRSSPTLPRRKRVLKRWSSASKAVAPRRGGSRMAEPQRERHGQGDRRVPHSHPAARRQVQAFAESRATTIARAWRRRCSGEGYAEATATAEWMERVRGGRTPMAK